MQYDCHSRAHHHHHRRCRCSLQESGSEPREEGGREGHGAGVVHWMRCAFVSCVVCVCVCVCVCACVQHVCERENEREGERERESEREREMTTLQQLR